MSHDNMPWTKQWRSVARVSLREVGHVIEALTDCDLAKDAYQCRVILLESRKGGYYQIDILGTRTEQGHAQGLLDWLDR